MLHERYISHHQQFQFFGTDLAALNVGVVEVLDMGVVEVNLRMITALDMGGVVEVLLYLG